MAGLTRDGFIPLGSKDLTTRINTRLEAFSSGIDLTPESPDGHMVGIISFELAQAWSELNLVYNSYNPEAAIGAGLRNLGLITGLPLGAATRSQADVSLVGTAGTVVPRRSIILDGAGNEFRTSFDATIPANVQAIATLSGPIAVPAGTLTKIGSAIPGWSSVTQASGGRTGAVAQTEVQYRNTRNKTVLRNFVGVEEVMRARLMETLGIEQVVVLNNSGSSTLPDGTPPNTIHVTVGEVGGHITDEDIASVILLAKGLGCPTFGTSSAVGTDPQGISHTVSFSKAVAQSIFIKANITFLDEEYAGSKEAIETDLVAHVNALATNEDVVWSRLFGEITPHSKAQINSLEISKDGLTYVSTNIPIEASEFANTDLSLLDIQVTNT